MSGIDWNGVYERYAPLLDRVSTRGELSDLIWEMQGELGTSHAYEVGGDHRKPPSIALGHLAAELKLAHDGTSYEIVSIVAGDPWEAGADSPLNAVGVEAQVGDRIVAVNGLPVSRELPPQALLVHQAGAKVELTLARKTKDSATRTVLVTALTDEVPSRYREWVERNREWVHAQSGGSIGYFHLPDMQSHGFAEFHRYFSAECPHLPRNGNQRHRCPLLPFSPGTGSGALSYVARRLRNIPQPVGVGTSAPVVGTLGLDDAQQRVPFVQAVVGLCAR